ncbi:uncharacterized protein LOC141917309 [Strix aluco]|uniref:uncharacterized protein LOC141917309 n=1 Tax=Strix aluco TaxID=111821 RepID=UPI003DA5E5B9
MGASDLTEPSPVLRQRPPPLGLGAGTGCCPGGSRAWNSLCQPDRFLQHKVLLVVRKEIPLLGVQRAEGMGTAPAPTMGILKEPCTPGMEGYPSPPCGACGCQEKDPEKTCGYRLLSQGKPGLEQLLSAGSIPSAQDAAGGEERDSTSRCAMGGGDGNGSCSNDGVVEAALDPQDRPVPPATEVPVDPKKRTERRLGGKWHQLHRVRVPYPVLLLIGVVLVALVVAVAALSAGRRGGSLAPVLACPYEWVSLRGVCYYLSSEEGSWEWSREWCSSLGASLAVLKEQWEMEFLTRLQSNIDYWVGLQRRGWELEWVDGSSCNQTYRLLSRGEPRLEQPLSAGSIPSAQGAAGGEERDSTSRCAMGGGDGNGSCSNDVDVEAALVPQDRPVPPATEVPVDPKKRTERRLGGKWHQLHRVRVPYPVLLLIGVVLVALVVAVAALSAGRRGGSLAPVLACPYEWVSLRGVCYYLSSEEGSWEWSRERCSSLGASLAVLKEQWEMEFLTRLQGNIYYWVGLQRRGRELEWVDGSSCNQTFHVEGQEPCVYLSEGCLRAASCSQARPYLCSKPQVLA